MVKLFERVFTAGQRGWLAAISSRCTWPNELYADGVRACIAYSLTISLFLFQRLIISIHLFSLSRFSSSGILPPRLGIRWNGFYLLFREIFGGLSSILIQLSRDFQYDEAFSSLNHFYSSICLWIHSNLFSYVCITSFADNRTGTRNLSHKYGWGQIGNPSCSAFRRTKLINHKHFAHGRNPFGRVPEGVNGAAEKLMNINAMRLLWVHLTASERESDWIGPCVSTFRFC